MFSSFIYFSILFRAVRAFRVLRIADEFLIVTAIDCSKASEYRMKAFVNLKKVKAAIKRQSEKRYFKGVLIISFVLLSISLLTLVPMVGHYFFSFIPVLETHICYRMIDDYSTWLNYPLNYDERKRA